MLKTKYPVFKCLHRGEKGFTLIELIIVVAILGILAAVIIPNITKFLGVGQKGAAQGELGTVQQGAYAAMAEQGVGAIDASPVHGEVNSGQGAINTAPPIDLAEYLQGGLAGLKGSWYITANGLVGNGTYPQRGQPFRRRHLLGVQCITHPYLGAYDEVNLKTGRNQITGGVSISALRR